VQELQRFDGRNKCGKACAGKGPIILTTDQAYIGVMIDDLVTWVQLNHTGFHVAC